MGEAEKRLARWISRFVKMIQLTAVFHDAPLHAGLYSK
jgi:hypothetical protein